MTGEQFDQLHKLMQKMWWSADRTKEEMKIMLQHCLPFVVIEDSTQHLVGFARVLTDGVRYAYIYDVMTEEHLRGIGIGKTIMSAVLAHHRFTRVKYFELTCAHDMVGYYKKFGFLEDLESVVAMRKIVSIKNLE
tara:strand:- start:1057 stop:1461 length:405 start_codon:yes stop_codon:yes gene_type:complete